MKTRRSWREKLLDSKDLPRGVDMPARLGRKWGGGTVVIPAPIEVDRLLRQVPRRRLAIINDLRRTLAARHGADIGCPLTTGLFAVIAAHAADEQERAGKKRITPYWRTLKAGGELNPKYPGGISCQKDRLEGEGHRVVRKGTRYFVADFDRALVRLR